MFTFQGGCNPAQHPERASAEEADMQAPRAALVFALVIALIPVGRGKPSPLPTPGKEDRKSW